MIALIMLHPYATTVGPNNYNMIFAIRSADSESSCADIAQWFPRLHSIVIGPGLGRDPGIMATVKARES